MDGATRPKCLRRGVKCRLACEGGATGAAVSVSVPAVAVVRRTDGHAAGLAGTVGEVHSAAAENSARLHDTVTPDHQTRSSAAAAAAAAAYGTD